MSAMSESKHASAIKTLISLDRSDEKIVVESVQDVEPVLDWNKVLRSVPQRSDWGRHVASIPLIILQKWLDEEFRRGHSIRWYSEEFDELVDRKLRDPEWKYLRTDGHNFNLGWR